MEQNINVGDIITAYHKGYWRVIKLEKILLYCNLTTQVTYEKVLNSNFKPPSKVTKSCDIRWCRKVNREYIQSLREDFNTKMNKLEELINVSNN